MSRRGTIVFLLSIGIATTALLDRCGGAAPGRTLERTRVEVAGVAPEADANAAPDSNAAADANSPRAAGWKMPVPDREYGAREGRALFHHYCATCHGDGGQGDGLNAYNLDPKPRDLSDPAFQKKRSDDDLAGVIRSGGGVAGLSTGMPPWGRTLGERKVRQVVTYIRTLKPPAP